ncbi:MAG: hypothetical protein ABSF61_13645 [Anaerolineales bacterium]|jgi:hypothetical protein
MQMQEIEPKFLKNLRSALKIKHFARRTKETYVYWIRRYRTFPQGHRDLDAAVVAETPSQDADCGGTERSAKGTSLLVDHGWGGIARRIGTWDQAVTGPTS